MKLNIWILLPLLFTVALTNLVSNTEVASAQNKERSVGFGRGLSTPSSTSVLISENPSGHRFHSGVKIQGFGFQDKEKTTTNYGGMLAFGNGTLGAGVGASQLDYKEKTAKDPKPVGLWGAAAHLSSLKTDFGIGGSYQKSETNTTVDQTNAGLVINSGGDLYLGITGFNIFEKETYYGGGLGYKLNADLTLIGDYLDSYQSEDYDLWVGGLYQSQKIDLAIGFHEFKDSSKKDGEVFLGVGVKLINSIWVQYYYQVYGEHYLGLTFDL